MPCQGGGDFPRLLELRPVTAVQQDNVRGPDALCETVGVLHRLVLVVSPQEHEGRAGDVRQTGLPLRPRVDERTRRRRLSFIVASSRLMVSSA